MSNFPALNRFNLTTPEKVTIKTLDLPRYASEFYSADEDKITFTVPTAGDSIQSTANSTYPRCEFRETNVDETLNNWDATKSQVNWMEYHIAVVNPGPAGKVIIGQIHGKTNSPLCKVQYNDEDDTGRGTIMLQYRANCEGPEKKIPIKTDVAPGQILQLRITLTNDFMLIIHDDGNEVARAQLNQASYTAAEDRFYFKVGAYVQTKVNAADGTGIVVLYHLDLHHGDAFVVPVEKPLHEQLQDLIDQVGIDYRNTLLTKTEAATQLNALSKEVAKVPDDKLRAPLYAKIKEIKATL